MALGVVIGILVAHKFEKETRNDLMEKSEKLMKMGNKSVSDVIEKNKGPGTIRKTGGRRINKVNL